MKLKTVLLFSLLLIVFPLFSNNDVKVTSTVVTKLKPGEEKEIAVTVLKPGISGPARLKIISSNSSVEVESVSNQGANFKGKDNTYTFVWISVPETDKMEVKYKLKIGASATGLVSITTQFSYTIGDERYSAADFNKVIQIEKQEQPLATNNSTTIKEGPNETPKIAVEKPVPNVKITRAIQKEGSDFMISLTIDKGSEKGFGRLKEDVPAGFNAVQVNNQGAVFKFSDESVKFLWSQLPESKQFELKYKLMPVSATDGQKNIGGVFSAEFLIRGNDNNDVVISPSSFNYEAPKLVQRGPDPKPEEKTESVKTENIASSKSGGYSKKGNEDEPAMITSTVPKASASSGISYRVQIAAGKNNVESSYLKKKYRITETVQREEHAGWYKYTVGEYKNLTEATKSVRNLRNSIDGAFIVAYNNGKRITFQEAQMMQQK
ncbi:MAG: SPOR domain-containing protein [Flavobacteriales bacterium]